MNGIVQKSYNKISDSYYIWGILKIPIILYDVNNNQAPLHLLFVLFFRNKNSPSSDRCCGDGEESSGFEM